MTCFACMERCPIKIEHIPIMVNLRRYLVEQGEVDKSLQDALMSLVKRGNSLKQSDRMRAKWTKGLDFKIKDARKEEVEYLWFVGDFASYDPIISENTKRFARVLNKAGIDFGILYDGERNSGNDVRRVGEEGLLKCLFQRI
ncbi:MAG: putative iron-sulfur-binding oxidoreductase FadF [Candidatus Methanoperedenaceae archaeon GB50]|nr:MAG: putative iron-sulfur-binding oxidoreductase FadF [Candidatus Methanoperedenaceae archaeon GB50]